MTESHKQTLNNSELRVGIVGAGYVAFQVHVPVLLYENRVRIAFVFDENIERARSLISAYGLKIHANEITDVDAVLLAVPYGARWQYIDDFGSRGVHLILEKPCSLNDGHSARIKSAVKEAKVFCGFQRRYYENTLLLRQLLSCETSPEEVESVEVMETFITRKSVYTDTYKTNPHLAGGGVLAETGCHSIDQISFITNARDFRFGEKELLRDETGVDVVASFRLLIQSGERELPVTFKYSRVEDLGSGISVYLTRDRSLQIAGASDYVRMNSGVRHYLYRRTRPLGAKTSLQSFYLQWVSILDDIIKGIPSPSRFDASLSVASIIGNVYESN